MNAEGSPVVPLTVAGRDCVVSLRKDASGEAFLRVSPHFYNTADEIGRFLDLLGPAEAA